MQKLEVIVTEPVMEHVDIGLEGSTLSENAFGIFSH